MLMKSNGGLEICRSAGSSKKLKTLDGVRPDLNEDDLVVADAKNVLALAGTMGGLDYRNHRKRPPHRA
jgi:phenylalanyl-tRNA synthetase beta subunit